MKQYLYNLLREGKLNELFEALELLEHTQSKDLNDPLILLQSRFHRNERENLGGRIDARDYGIEYNKIENAVKVLIETELDESKIPTTLIESITAPKPAAAPEATESGGNIIINKTITVPKDFKGGIFQNVIDMGTMLQSIAPPPLKILMLTSLPAGTTEVDLNKEFTQIVMELQEKRSSFEFSIKKWVSKSEFKKFTETEKPEILHFSGHGVDGGNHGGLVLQNEEKNGYELLSPDNLEFLFKYFKRSFQVQAVILNSCLSDEQAIAIAKHVPYVIGTTVEIANDYCVAFSVGFYFKLVDSERNYLLAFDSGRTEAVMKGAKETDFVLYKDGKLWDMDNPE